jgi:hypothetical protein
LFIVFGLQTFAKAKTKAKNYICHTIPKEFCVAISRKKQLIIKQKKTKIDCNNKKLNYFSKLCLSKYKLFYVL